MKNISIAIDGPAGSGKSTIAKLISKEYGIIYLDTGAMYRTFALFALRNKADLSNRGELEALLDSFNIEVKYINEEQRVLLNGEDVSSLIRTNEISTGASAVGLVPAVRIKMVEIQRKIALGTSVVMDGREIGTYVLPNAEIKIFLVATPDVRARRRYLELVERGDNSLSEEEIKQDIIKRDKNDMEREFAPLKQAEDAILLDTSEMSIEEVCSEVRQIVDKFI